MARFSLGHIAAVATGCTAFVAMLTATGSWMLVWWDGKDAGPQFINPTEYPTVEADASLWEVTYQIQQEKDDGSIVRYSYQASWFDHCKEHTLNAPHMGDVCFKMDLIRWLGGVAISWAFSAIFAAFIAFKMSPLLAVFAAFCATCGGLCTLVQLVLAAMLNSSTLTFGSFMAVVSLLLEGTTIGAALYAAAKEVKIEAEREPEREMTRQEKARAFRVKQEEQMEDMKKKKGKDTSKQTEDDDSEDEQEKEEEKPIPHNLQRLLHWSDPDFPDSENKEGEDVPDEVLLKAFNDIDVDQSGSILLEELLDALKLCGLEVSDTAATTVMNELDADQDGSVDFLEFTKFFRELESLNQFEQRTKTRAQFATIMLNCGFLVDLVATGILLMLFIKFEPKSGDNYIILQNMLVVCVVTLIILFVCVVALPAAKLTLGPTFNALIIKYFRKKPKKKKVVTEDTLRETAWAPKVETAPVHPELMAQSYRNVRRVQQLQDTAREAFENQQNRDMSRTGFSKTTGSKRMASHTTADTQSDSGFGHTNLSGRGDRGLLVNDSGQTIGYDKDSYKVAQVMMRKQKPQASFSALQVRTELDSAAFDASRTGTHFYAAAQPAGSGGQLAIGGY